MFFAERRSQVHLTHQVPDYAMLAQAYGALGLTVESEDELGPALEEALASGRTAVSTVASRSRNSASDDPRWGSRDRMIEYGESVEAM